MKKLMFLAAAVAAMAACSKSQVVYDDNDVEIGLSPVNYSTTKAQVPGPVEGTTYPSEEQFKVFALYTSSAAGTAFSSSENTTEYFSDATFTRRDNFVWGGVTPYYWPKTGSLYFTGYSPAEFILSDTRDRPSVVYDKTNGSKLTIPGFVQGQYKYTDGTATPENYSMVDLMYFDIYPSDNSVNNAGSTGVPVTFNHSLSWLTFNFSTADNFLNDLFCITKVTLKNVAQCASFVSGPTLGTTLIPKWINHTSSADIVLYDNTSDDSKGTNKLSYYDYSAASGEKFTIDDVLVIPQDVPGYTENTTLEIQYTQKANADSPEVKQTQSFSLKGGVGVDNEFVDEWIINRHYTYNITFSASEILIDPDVAVWQPVEHEINN